MLHCILPNKLVNCVIAYLFILMTLQDRVGMTLHVLLDKAVYKVELFRSRRGQNKPKIVTRGMDCLKAVAARSTRCHSHRVR